VEEVGGRQVGGVARLAVRVSGLKASGGGERHATQPGSKSPRGTARAARTGSYGDRCDNLV
jgi:hypothetical protein